MSSSGSPDPPRTRSEDLQEDQYSRPYHHLLVETGRGIPYINLMKLLAGFVDPQPGEQILDAGCGDGRLLHEIAGSDASLFGVDHSLKALRYAAGFTPRAFLSLQNLQALAFENESFTKATLIETLEHIPPTAVANVLSELRRVLRSGGRLIVTVPTHRLPLPQKHYRHFSPDELMHILEEFFEVESLTGHDRDSSFYRLLVAISDNRFWHLRAGFNRMLRFFYRRFLERTPPEKARRLIAVCVKKDV